MYPQLTTAQILASSQVPTWGTLASAAVGFVLAVGACIALWFGRRRQDD
ncbi:EGFR-like transmembrane domain-containing protein [Spirillospora sp. CA-294931]